MRYEMIITDPEDIKAFEEYDGRILSQEESESLKEARKEIKRLEIVILKGRELCNTYEDYIEEQNHKIKLVERYIDSLKCYSDECLGCENDIIRDITKTILNSHTCDSLKCEQDES